jgi:hypothetical protein
MLSLSRFLPDLNWLLITIGPFFWEWHIRVKALPIVKSLLGAVGETYNEVRLTVQEAGLWVSKWPGQIF